MKDFLQGNWLGHPLHPVVVHLPTALWPAAAVFDVLSRVTTSGRALTQASFYAIVIGLLSALAAMPAGIADWLDIRKEKPAWRLGLAHMLLNFTLAMLWALNLGLRLDIGRPRPSTFERVRRSLGLRVSAREPAVRLREAETTSVLPLALSLAGTLLLVVSGYLGGRMVYDEGTSVARLSKRRLRRMAIEGGARVPRG